MKKIMQIGTKKQVSFYLPLEMYKEFKMKSLQEDVSMNSLLLDAISLLLEKNNEKSKKKKLSGKDFLECIKPMMGYGDGDPNASKNIDAILYS